MLVVSNSLAEEVVDRSQGCRTCTLQVLNFNPVLSFISCVSLGQALYLSFNLGSFFCQMVTRITRLQGFG